MSATFPTNDPSERVFQKHEAIFIEERGTHVPTFYIRHQSPESIRVMRKGIPLLPGFTVAQVPPERRWAIGPDGNLLAQADFESRLTLAYEEAYTLIGQKVNGDPKREPVPDVARYVSVQIDPTNPSRFIPMGYDPNATLGRKPEKLFDRHGENPRNRMEVLKEAYSVNPANLLPSERAEVEREIGVSTSDPKLARLESLSADLASGRISADDYATTVSALMGHAIVLKRQEPAKATVQRRNKPTPITMACGKQLDPRGKLWHVKKCQKCQESPEVA